MGMSSTATNLVTESVSQLRLSEVIGALSFALDLTEGQPRGHCLRACLVGMNIGKALGLKKDELHDLYYTLLLKDAGCSSNAARLCQLYGSDDIKMKKDYKTVNSDSLTAMAQFVFSHTKMSGPLRETLSRAMNLATNGEALATELIVTRCEQGAAIARELGFNNFVADGIHSLDEHWNGSGKPLGVLGKAIPLYSRIALLSQVIDIFHTVHGAEKTMEEVRFRNGTWFDPELCQIFIEKIASPHFWEDLKSKDTQRLLTEREFEPDPEDLELSEERFDSIANAFAKIVDAKSSYTYGHSSRVAMYSEMIATKMNFPLKRRKWIKRAALLHDLGKLAVSNCILDKPDKLDEEEWKSVRLHPHYTEIILAQILPFQELAEVAGAHHERLDGKGYPKGLSGDKITMETRVITIADVYDALTAARPYRGPMEPQKAIAIMNQDRGKAFDDACLDALIECIKEHT
jgi:HD-GYP domain-containing protein (c-di-GMP phosphodiesterase class II)